MINNISKIIAAAVLIESIITYFNQFFVSGTIPWQMVLSLTLGIIMSITYEFNLPECLNMQSHVPYVDWILTGILISRGSNYLYDMIGSLESL